MPNNDRKYSESSEVAQECVLWAPVEDRETTETEFSIPDFLVSLPADAVKFDLGDGAREWRWRRAAGKNRREGKTYSNGN